MIYYEEALISLCVNADFELVSGFSFMQADIQSDEMFNSVNLHL